MDNNSSPELTPLLRRALGLYFNGVPGDVKLLDLCRGGDDFRKVMITEDGGVRLVVKVTSNTFTDAERIRGWSRLIGEYNRLGIYSPQIIPLPGGGFSAAITEDGREYHVFAEEFAKYPTAEQISGDKLKDAEGRCVYLGDMLRSVGRVGAAHLDVVDFPSAYCLLEPHSPPDTTDEGTECAVLFHDYIRDELPGYLGRADKLLALFYENQEKLRSIYHTLPETCFQSDLNESNVLIDGDKFAGLIDYNLCGREKVLNYASRAALWFVYTNEICDKEDEPLYFYDDRLDDLRMNEFLRNMGNIRENYAFTDAERDAFPVLFRYINSFWWQHVREIKKIRDDGDKIDKLFRWLEKQMTRGDIPLP